MRALRGAWRAIPHNQQPSEKLTPAEARGPMLQPRLSSKACGSAIVSKISGPVTGCVSVASARGLRSAAAQSRVAENEPETYVDEAARSLEIIQRRLVRRAAVHDGEHAVVPELRRRHIGAPRSERPRESTSLPIFGIFRTPAESPTPGPAKLTHIGWSVSVWPGGRRAILPPEATTIPTPSPPVATTPGIPEL